MNTRSSLKSVAIALGMVASQIGYAQLSSNVTVKVSGFNSPRGLKFGPDGLLYVAEGGTGGTASTVGMCTQVVPPIGPYTGGFTARISKITSGGVGKRSWTVFLRAPVAVPVEEWPISRSSDQTCTR